MVRPERFELPTYCSGGNRSIHLSYGRTLIASVYMDGLRSINEALRGRCITDRDHSITFANGFTSAPDRRPHHRGRHGHHLGRRGRVRRPRRAPFSAALHLR